MKLAFLPCELYLIEAEDGSFRLTLRGKEILRTRSRRAAVAKFKELRQEVERRLPTRELTGEEKAQMLRMAIADSLVAHNSLGGRKKKSTARSTRTFGG